MEGTFTLLGTGASTGVPVIGCHCAVCASDDPFNKRLRCSAFIKTKDQALLIDPGPDLRQQALMHGIDHLDGVMVTHTHYDHIAGIDELRIFYYYAKKELPCLLSARSLEDIQTRYYYMFRPKMHGQSIPAQLDFHALPSLRGEMEFQGIPLRYFTYDHSGMRVTGFRFGSLAYVCDIYEYPDTIFEDLEGVTTLVVSALRKEESKIHFTVERAVEFSNRVGAEQTWFTHIGHEIDHAAINAQLPANIRMGYDGLQLHWKI